MRSPFLTAAKWRNGKSRCGRMGAPVGRAHTGVCIQTIPTEGDAIPLKSRYVGQSCSYECSISSDSHIGANRVTFHRAFCGANRTFFGWGCRCRIPEGPPCDGSGFRVETLPTSPMAIVSPEISTPSPEVWGLEVNFDHWAGFMLQPAFGVCRCKGVSQNSCK